MQHSGTKMQINWQIIMTNFSSSQPTVIQQPQSIQYQIIQTEDGVQMVQEIQTVQAVEAVEMPKVNEFL